jgi:hypothetical protein
MDGDLQATKENTNELEAVGRLHGIGVPLTIRDAMTACKKLGERYLWVDRLCIIQDDMDIKQSQIDAMGEIFRCASFTIAAIAGDGAHHGLPGVSSVLRAPQRQIIQEGWNILKI